MADTLVLEKELWPEFGAGDLVKLPNYHAYLKLALNENLVKWSFYAAF